MVAHKPFTLVSHDIFLLLRVLTDPASRVQMFMFHKISQAKIHDLPCGSARKWGIEGQACLCGKRALERNKFLIKQIQETGSTPVSIAPKSNMILTRIWLGVAAVPRLQCRKE